MKADIGVMLKELSKDYLITVESLEPGDYDELPDGGWSIELSTKILDNRSYSGVWIGKTLDNCVGRAWAGEPEDKNG